MTPTLECSPLGLFRRIISQELLSGLCQKHGWRFRWRIYPPVVVFWLMITQRLQTPGTLAQTVGQASQEDLQGLWPEDRQWQNHSPSSHTGGFCRARKRIPVAMSRELVEALTHGLEQSLGLPEQGRQIFLLDGSSLQLQERGDFLDGSEESPVR